MNERRRPRPRLLVVSSLLVGALAAGCSERAPTALTVAVSSEVPVPETVDRVQIRVEYEGRGKFDQTYDLDASGGDARIPGTLTLVREDDDTTGPVRVTVTAVNRATGGATVVRQAIVGFSEERTKLLRMPLRFSCLDFPGTCAEGETCKAGACAPASADPDALPDYDEAQVFGRVGDGRCFDRAACVPKDQTIDLTALVRATKDDRCEVALADVASPAATEPAPKPAGAGPRPLAATSERLNFGVVWSRNPSGKWTAVDHDPEEGWSFTDETRARVRFAPGLCRAIRGELPGVSVVKVIANGACAPKPPTQPECQ